MVRNNLETEELYTLELRQHKIGCWKYEGVRYRPYFSKPVPSLVVRTNMAAKGIDYLTAHVQKYRKHPKSVEVTLHAGGIRIIIRD